MGDNTFYDAVKETVEKLHLRQDREIAIFDSDSFQAMSPKEQVEFARTKLEKFLPDIKDMNDQGIRDYFAQIKDYGPVTAGGFKGQLNECLIQEPDKNLSSIQVLAGAMTGLEPDRLKPLPGAYDDWIAMIGHHEAEHCNQYTQPDHAKTPLQQYKDEIGGDREAISYMRAEGKGNLVQALVDIRAIGAIIGSDPKHDTSILAKGGTISPEAFAAAQGIQDAADKAVDARLNGLGMQELHGLGLDNTDAGYRAAPLREDRPDSYMQNLKAALDDGAFDKGNPYTKAYVKQATDAWGRYGTPDKPLESKVPLDQLVESNTHYVAVASVMENIRRGGPVEKYEENTVRYTMDSPDTPKEVISALEQRYPKEIKPYLPEPEEKNAPVTPQMTPPAPVVSAGPSV